MKIEVKELKKAIEILAKEDVSLVNLTANDSLHYVEIMFTNLKGDIIKIRLGEEGSGMFSKLIKEEIF